MANDAGFSKDLNRLFQFPLGGIYSTVLSKSGSHDVTLMCLSKGSGLEEHTSTKNGFVIVLQGEGVFNLSGKRLKMKPGVLIHMPANAVHSLKSSKNLAILLMLTK